MELKELHSHTLIYLQGFVNTYFEGPISCSTTTAISSTIRSNCTRSGPSAMTRYPQILKNVRVQTKSGWEDNNLIMARP